jgi:hypothetical protein
LKHVRDHNSDGGLLRNPVDSERTSPRTPDIGIVREMECTQRELEVVG